MMDKKTHQLNMDSYRYHARGNRYVDYCIYATLVCNFLILLGNPLGIDVLVSLGTRAMIVFILLLAIRHFIGCFQRKTVDIFDALFVALAVCSAMCYILTTFPGVLSKAVPYMCFLTLPAYITLYRNAKQIKNLKKTIYVANIVWFCLFFWLSFSEYSHVYYGEYGIEIIDELTLGYGNPNETGMYLLISYIIMLCAFTDAKKKKFKCIMAVCVLVLLYMIWQTESRICIILAALLAALMALKHPKNVLAKSQGITLILPIAGVAFTMLVPQSVLEWEFLGDILDTGRKALFMSFFSTADVADYLAGDYTRYAGANLHNSFLSLTAMFGVPVAWLYFRFLRQALRVYWKKLNSRVSHIAYAGILAMIVHGIAEGTMLVAGAVYAGLGGLLFVLMLPECESVDA